MSVGGWGTNKGLTTHIQELASKLAPLCSVLALLSGSVMSDSLRPHGLYPHQAPLSMGFSRQEYWTGLPCPPPGDLPNPRIKPRSPVLQILYQLCYLGNPMLMPLTTIKSKSVSFSCCSIAKSCLTLCDPMDCSIQCFPVLPCSSESFLFFRISHAQIYVHWVYDAT